MPGRVRVRVCVSGGGTTVVSWSGMSFFEPPPLPEEPGPERRVRPPWLGPPNGSIGAAVSVPPFVLARAEGLAVGVTNLVAYTSGIEFTLSIRRQASASSEWDAHDMLMAPRRPRHRSSSGKFELSPELFRFGVQFGDGRKVTNLGRPFPSGWTAYAPMQVAQATQTASRAPEPDQDTVEPVLVEHGGSSSGTRSDQSYWLWPLPPPGLLAFVCEWPSEGITLTRVEIDAAPILEAATHALVLWEEQPE